MASSHLKNLPARLVVLATALVLCTTIAAAQTSGTVSVSGTVNAAVKLTSGGAATLAGNSGGGITTQSAADAALATVVNLGDVGPGNTSNYVCFNQPLYLRTNAPSTLSAAVTAETFGGGASDLSKNDIGLGFLNLAAGGPNADISTSSVVGLFAANPCAAPKDADGVPTYSATLNDLGTATPGTAVLLSTGPISLRGSFNSPNNRALLDMRMAVAPQSFGIGNFSATVTLTITSP